MDSIRLESEELDRTQRKLEEHTPSAVLGELIERSSDAVVVDRQLLRFCKPERSRLDGFDPLAQAVEGISRHEDIVDENTDRPSVTHRPIAIAVNVLVEDARNV